MSKRFDPEALETNEPTPALKPVDFMRPMEEVNEAKEEKPTTPVPSKQPTVERKDMRLLPAPADDVYVAKTYRLKQHRHQQLIDEHYHTGQDIQVIVDTALGEYFEKRYGTPPAEK